MKIVDTFYEKVAKRAIKHIGGGLSILPFFGQRLASRAIFSTWNTGRAIQKGYKESVYVYACINRISRAFASVPWIVHEEQEDGSYEPLPGHPLELLMRKPNPYTPGGEFWERVITHLYLGGNGILNKVRADDIVAELWLLQPDLIKPVASESEFIEYYDYRWGGIHREVPPADIVHLMFVDPANPYWGLSPMMALSKTVDTDLEAINWQKVSLQNRAITDGVFTFDHNITREQWQGARQMIRDNQQGSDNARAPWVLGSGAKWQQMSLTPMEMDFINTRKFTREEICSIFQVPPPMIGLYEQATLANIEVARRIFWIDTIVPLLEQVRSSLNLGLTPDFGENIRLDYDLSVVEAFQENFNEKVTSANTLFNMGVPFNEINNRMELGFRELRGGNVGYLSAGLLPTMRSPAEDVIPDREDIENEERAEDMEEARNPDNKYKSKYSQKQIQRQWKNFDDTRSAVEQERYAQISQVFIDEGREVESLFRTRGIEGVNEFLRTESVQRWENFLETMYDDVAVQFGQREFEQLEQARNPNSHKTIQAKQFDPATVGVGVLVRTIANRIARSLGLTTSHEIIRLVRRGLQDGLPEGQIASQLLTRYAEWARIDDPETYHSRSITIAQTEVGSFSNYGAYAGALAFSTQLGQIDQPMMKTWVSQGDARVRESHELQDQLTIPLMELFPNGLLHPLDPNSVDLAEIANCRCFAVYEEQI